LVEHELRERRRSKIEWSRDFLPYVASIGIPEWYRNLKFYLPCFSNPMDDLHLPADEEHASVLASIADPQWTEPEFDRLKRSLARERKPELIIWLAQFYQHGRVVPVNLPKALQLAEEAGDEEPADSSVGSCVFWSVTRLN
jgi:hypothetical protein